MQVFFIFFRPNPKRIVSGRLYVSLSLCVHLLMMLKLSLKLRTLALRSDLIKVHSLNE